MEGLTRFRQIKEYADALAVDAELRHPELLVYDHDGADHRQYVKLRRMRSDFFELSFEAIGGCRLSVDGIELPSDNYRLSWYAPGRVVDTSKVELGTSGPYEGYSVLFTPGFVLRADTGGSLASRLSVFRHQVIPAVTFNAEEAGSISAAITGMLREYEQYGSYSDEIIRHALASLLFKAEQHLNVPRTAPHASAREWEIVQNFERLVATHVREKNMVEEYARMLFITPKHLSQTVKKVKGRTALERINDARVTAARELLTSTGKSISEIAGMLGFHHIEYFSVFFKRMTGYTPSEFRSL